MSDLPKERLQSDQPPFSEVGMDSFGPFELNRGRSSNKRYGVILTCMVSRAVHLEEAASLDTDSCINAITRFISRRGKHILIRSDNGTNLVGAEKEMRASISIDSWNIDHICDNFMQKGIQWEFKPPFASHFGGFLERLIRSVCKVLYNVMHEQTVRLDNEGLQTLSCEVESILNGPPLTELPNRPNDLEALTPNHILLLEPGESFPPGTFKRANNHVHRRWRHIQYMSDMFWNRWVQEYLPLLQQRQKWFKVERNVQIGDLVLVAESTPRNCWNLERIIEVEQDSNNVRVVKVKTASTTLKRPISKLCLLFESDHDS